MKRRAFTRGSRTPTAWMASHAITRQTYEDPQVVRKFRRCRGAVPRDYERRLMSRLLELARARRTGNPTRRTLRLLDVGCGYGRDLAWLQAQQGIEAFGAELSTTMLRAASRCVRRSGSLIQSDLRRLGIASASMDLVRAQAVLHHLTPRDADRATAEMARILRPGGFLRVFVRQGMFCGMREEPGLGRRYFRYYTLPSLRALLRRHGFTVFEVESVTPKDPRRLTFLAIIAMKS